MDELSRRSQALGGSASDVPAAAAPALGGLTQAVEQEGGLDGLLGKLREGGLGDQVDLRVSTGSNEPVDPQRLGEALGPDTVQRLSAGSGIDIAALLPMLAMFLPQIIDMLTPNGTTPAGGVGGAAGGDLGGLLGGLLGGQTGAGGTSGTAGLDDLLGGLGGMLGGDKGR